MARKKNTTITLRMNAAESEWTAVADEVPDLEVHHLLPSVCVNTLSDALREHYGNPDLEIKYSVTLSPRHEKMLEELKKKDRDLAELEADVDRRYREIAKALTQVRLKQHDIADVLGVSQSHVNKLIKMSATGTGSIKVSGTAGGEGSAGRRRG